MRLLSSLNPRGDTVKLELLYKRGLPGNGFEPLTKGFSVPYSTTELSERAMCAFGFLHFVVFL
jgi:hypothetical protein